MAKLLPKTAPLTGDCRMMVTIRAITVRDNHNGTFDIEVPGYSLNDEERLTLEHLFPNLAENAYRLLNQESLLASLATPAERTAKGTSSVQSTYDEDR